MKKKTKEGLYGQELAARADEGESNRKCGKVALGGRKMQTDRK